MKLTDLQAIAARGMYFVRITLDPLYPPYSNWDTRAGQSAYELNQLFQDLQLWPRVKVRLEQPVGNMQESSLCDLQTLLYLMNEMWGACRPPITYEPSVTCTTPVVFLQGTYVGAPPTTGTNLTLTGTTVVPLVPCYRDWVALGLGNPPHPYVGP